MAKVYCQNGWTVKILYRFFIKSPVCPVFALVLNNQGKLLDTNHHLFC